LFGSLPSPDSLFFFYFFLLEPAELGVPGFEVGGDLFELLLGLNPNWNFGDVVAVEFASFDG